MNNQSNKKRFEIIGTGGGGKNIASALFQLIQTRVPSGTVGLTVCDTNEQAFIGLPEECQTFTIGEGNGSGRDPEWVKSFFDLETEDQIKLARAQETTSNIRTLFRGDTFEAAAVCASLGKGTGTGSALPLAKLLVMENVLAFGVLAFCSLEHAEVEENQNEMALKAIQEWDDSGIPYIVILNRWIYNEAERKNEKISRRDAYNEINQYIAKALTGVLRLLADPREADREDLRKQLYASGAGNGENSRRKRWRLGFAELPSDFSDEALENATAACFNNDRFDFENERIGGTLVIREGNFSAKDISNQNLMMRKLVNGVEKNDNKNFCIIEAEYESPENKSAFTTFLFSEWNGKPDYDKLPEIRWIGAKKPAKIAQEPAARPTAKAIPVVNGLEDNGSGKFYGDTRNLHKNSEPKDLRSLLAVLDRVKADDETNIANLTAKSAAPLAGFNLKADDILFSLDNPNRLGKLWARFHPSWHTWIFDVLAEHGKIERSSLFEKVLNPEIEEDEAVQVISKILMAAGDSKLSEKDRNAALKLKAVFALKERDEWKEALAKLGITQEAKPQPAKKEGAWMRLARSARA